VCLDLNEVEKAVSDGRVDFTITNPAVYVSLEYIYGASRIATLKDRGDQAAATQFGSVIFSQSGRSDLATLADLKGKRVAAVAQTSFGGWLMAWRLFKQSGIDPFKDFATLRFAGQQNRVVAEVLQGRADVGVVRTGILEHMVEAGQIDVAAYSVLHRQPDEGTFPYAHSTELYPHYALAKMYHVSNELAEQVMLTFFDINESSEVARTARIQGWTIPLDYYSVHLCLQELKTGPYQYLNAPAPPVTIGQLYQEYRLWVLGAAGLFAVILGAMMHVFFLNRKLSVTTLKLYREHRAREKMVADLNEFKATLDNVRDSVFMFDVETLRFLYVNQGGLDQIGYTLDEMKQMTPLDIKPDFTETQFEELLVPLRGSSTDSLTFTTRHRRKDGTLVPVEVFLQYIIPEGKKGRFVAIVRDITRRLAERKEREQLLTRLNSEQKLASIGQLAAGIAHEINTPTQYLGSNIDFLGDAFTDIDALIGQYDRLASEPDASGSPGSLVARMSELRTQADWVYLAEEIPRAISQSKEGVTKISAIVLAMKEFSHPGCKEKQTTDLNKLIDTTITVASNEWKYVAEIDRQLDPALPSFSCLPNEMGQVILNILVNAVHAIEEKLGKNREDGAKGKITIGSRRVDNRIEITIADTGGGIPEAIGSRVFDPFFTTKEVGRGTGQGLAICHDIIVNKHGGSIEFVSTEGEGTTFIIRLPLEKKHDD
jgi:PAS domain S-box-containing protein